MRYYWITLKYMDWGNGVNGPKTEKIIYSQKIRRQFENPTELFRAQMDYLTRDRGYSPDDIVLISWEMEEIR